MGDEPSALEIRNTLSSCTGTKHKAARVVAPHLTNPEDLVVSMDAKFLPFTNKTVNVLSERIVIEQCALIFTKLDTEGYREIWRTID